MVIKKILSLVVAISAISACTLAPKYNRPKVELPITQLENASKKKVTIISWQEYFQSPDLHRAIQTALFNNRDLRVANLNIESAQATHGIERSNLLPSINATASETKQGVPAAFASFMPRRQFRANLSLASYEIDFFGRLRSLKKSAQEDFLASKQARNVTKISLITETANSYLQLLLDRELLKIAEETLRAQTDKYKFIEMRYKVGIDSQSDLLNGESVIEEAKSNFEIYKKLVKQDENALMLLMGVFDRSALPQDEVVLSDVKIKEELLDFIPSEALFSRPDVLQAEHELKSANANIGAARAAFFPSITLTGNYGYASREMTTLFDSKTWAFTPQINMPLFAGGRNVYNLKLADLRKKVEIAQYEKAIQTAFRESLDQLAEREAVKSQMESADKILTNKKKLNDISNLKHEVGISSSLNVIEDKINFLTATQNQIIAKKDCMANLITLYKVMGGGSELSEK
jgi:outer membrane protein, multidrug efflux system